MPISKSPRVSRPRGKLGTLPANHVLQLAELVARLGVPTTKLFAGLAVDPDGLLDPDADLPWETVSVVVERARALTGDDAIGVTLGTQIPPIAFGAAGLAAVTAPTIGDAIAVMNRYMPTRTAVAVADLHVEGEKAQLSLEEHVDLGPLREILLHSGISAFWNGVRLMSGHAVVADADFACNAPHSVEGFERIGLRTRFNRPRTEVVFDRAILALAPMMADAISHKSAVADCERLLQETGGSNDVVASVARLVLYPRAGTRPLDEVANRLGVSSRTLKRRLAERGTTFSDVVEEQQRLRAALLLRTTDLSVPEISERLGYSHPANFSRAFQRWMGVRPVTFRRNGG